MVKVLKFYADWCGPCKVMAPRVEAVSEKMGIEVESINVDANPELAQKYGVRSIPYMVGLKDEAVIATLVGAKPNADLEEFFQKLV